MAAAGPHRGRGRRRHRAAILEAGHATADFVIVASGPNGASPHHETSDRVIEAGDPVVVDIGGTMPSGYCSDSTRTYVVGDAAEGLPRLLRGAAARATRRLRRRQAGHDLRARRRGRPRPDHRGRLRRGVPAPHRSRHRAGRARGAVHRGRQRPAAGSRAWRSPSSRASTWPAARCPDRGHRRVHPARRTPPQHHPRRIW